MKTKLILFALLAPLLALATTPFYYSGKNPDGTPQTNQVLLQAWPPAVNGVTIYGTNIIWGSVLIITNTPDATGYFSNSVYPNTYRVSIPALGSQGFAKIPDTAVAMNLAFYMTNAPVVSGNLGSAALINSLLGYTALSSNSAAVIAALTYTPMTNTYAAVSNVFQFNIATNGGPLAYSQLPFTPPTNSLAAITNLIGAGVTGTYSYTNGSGGHSTFAITNGVVQGQTTP